MSAKPKKENSTPSSARLKMRNAEEITTEIKEVPKVPTNSEEDIEKLRHMLIST